MPKIGIKDFKLWGQTEWKNSQFSWDKGIGLSVDKEGDQVV